MGIINISVGKNGLKYHQSLSDKILLKRYGVELTPF
jgi:hypothetical protein